MTRTKTLSKWAAVVTAATLTLGLGACSGNADASSSNNADSANTAAADTGTWPRTFTDDADHEVTIDAAPKRIVSTSISATGTLLAIEAPVVATSKSVPGDGTVDDDGFFSQWGDAARERNVKPLYTVGDFDLESVINEEPDLIIVSTSGADSVTDHYDELNAVAPTIVVNYGNKTWQDLAAELGEATGQEQAATAVVNSFNDHAAEVAAKLAVPAGTTASIVSYSAGDVSPVGKTTGPHAKLLESLGFTVTEPPAEYDTSTQKREDFAFTSYEGLADSLTGDYIFMIATDDAGVAALKADKTLANVAAVKDSKVYTLGAPSFRLDYYSATGVVDWFDASFTK